MLHVEWYHVCWPRLAANASSLLSASAELLVLTVIGAIQMSRWWWWWWRENTEYTESHAFQGGVFCPQKQQKGTCKNYRKPGQTLDLSHWPVTRPDPTQPRLLTWWVTRDPKTRFQHCRVMLCIMPCHKVVFSCTQNIHTHIQACT